MTLPEGFQAAKPMPRPGWTLETKTGAYAPPCDDHGHEFTEGLREITWSGGDLPDARFDRFVFRGTIGEDLAPGEVLRFATVQTCADGQIAWDGSDDDRPAPALTAPQGGGHHDHAAAAPETVKLGDLEIAGAFARATRPNAPGAGGVLSVTNHGAADDRLISARSDAAGRVEIHEMVMQGDVMRMRPLADGLPIPAGETVALKPGGFHLMFMDLRGPLVEGQAATITLVFEKAGAVEFTLPIRARDATGGHGHGAMDHRKMDHRKMDHRRLDDGAGRGADHASAAPAGAALRLG